MRVTSSVAGTLYLLVDPARDRKTLRVAAQQGYSPPPEGLASQAWRVDRGILARALETGRAIQEPDVGSGMAFRGRQGQGRSHLAVPIWQRGQPIGVLGLESDLEDGFTPQEIESAAHVADHAANAIQNALAYQRLDARLDALCALHQYSQSLAACLNLNALEDRVVQRALEALGAERAALYRYEPGTGAFTLASATHSGSSPTPDPGPRERALVEAAGKERTVQLAQDSSTGPTAALALCADAPPVNAGPAQEELLGVLLLSFQTERTPATDEQSPIRLLARAASIALRNARDVQTLQRSLQRLQERQQQLLLESKAPLTSIQGYAALMLQQIGGETTDEQTGFLEAIQRNAARLDALLNAPPKE
jgi:GAF domain-containing protein